MTAQPITQSEDDGNDFAPRPAGHHTWMSLAACKGTDPGRWWGTARDFPARRAAMAVCRSCPVQQECLSYALAYDERYGIWGGRDEQSRKDKRRQVRQWLATLDAFHDAYTDARRGQW